MKPDLCVIGAGAGGLSVAAAAAALGAQVVLVEHGQMDGDCLNSGGVRSMSLTAAARRAHVIAQADRFGLNAQPGAHDLARVFQRVKSVIAAIAPNDSRERYAGLGVRLIEGLAKFVDPRTVAVGEAFLIKARRFVIATGSRPAVPAIPGIDATPYFTDETVFDLDQCPRHLAVVGAGTMGLELAQAFRHLGAAVTVLETARPLAHEDPECAQIVVDTLARVGIVFRAGVTVSRVAEVPVTGPPSPVVYGSGLAPDVSATEVPSAEASPGNVQSVQARVLEAQPGQEAQRAVEAQVDLPLDTDEAPVSTVTAAEVQDQIPAPGKVQPRLQLILTGPHGEETIKASHILFAAERRPDVDRLGLEAARIKYKPHGIVVNGRLRTTNRRVYALGDVVGAEFAHAAHYHAGLVIRNTLFRQRAKVNEAAVPRVTFTDPELAHVGLTEQQAHRLGHSINVLRWPYHENDRAQAERQTIGHVKVVIDKTGTILGATIVGASAGELISAWTLGISQNLNIQAFAGVEVPYPTLAEIGKRAAMTYFTPRLTRPLVRRIIAALRPFR